MNLDYTIIEVEPDKNIDIDILHKSMMELGKDKTNDIFTHDDKSSYFSALQLDYQINYTIKKLNCIMDYYKLTRIKLCKDQIVDALVRYEMNENNQENVERRKELWNYIKELKKDEYFSNKIMFDG